MDSSVSILPIEERGRGVGQNGRDKKGKKGKSNDGQDRMAVARQCTRDKNVYGQKKNETPCSWVDGWMMRCKMIKKWGMVYMRLARGIN
jgi:hypothetical protein